MVSDLLMQAEAGRGSLRRLQMTGKRTPDRRTNETDNNVYRAKCLERMDSWKHQMVRFHLINSE